MYQRFYGLRAQPFRLGPDPHFFFTSATHKSALAYLRYGLYQGEGFIVVTGAVGTGKTTLALTLLSGLSRREMVIGELVTTLLQPEDLLRAIALAFQLDAGGTKADLLARLQVFFIGSTQLGKHVLLVVDEAHNLPLSSFEELRMLSNFHRGPQSLLQCILLGQPPLRDMLALANMEQIQQRVIAAHHLHPLCPQETRGYILHRLCQAGWRGDPTFTGEAIQYIHHYTQGIPRLINALCDRIMLCGYLEEKHQIDSSATTHAYSEWAQETGHTSIFEPPIQQQHEEVKFTGLERQHAAVAGAVGADTPAFNAEPEEHLKATVAATPSASMPSTANPTPIYVRRKTSIPPRLSDALTDNSVTIPYDAHPQAASTRHIAKIISRLFSDITSVSNHLSVTLSRAHPLLLPLAAVAVVLAAVLVFLPDPNPVEHTVENTAAMPVPSSRGQTVAAPTELKNVVAHIVKAAVPEGSPISLPVASPTSESPTLEIGKTPPLETVDTLPKPSSQAMEITQPAQDTQAAQVSQVAAADTGLVDPPPQPKVKARSKQTVPAVTAEHSQRKMKKRRRATFSPLPILKAADATLSANPKNPSIAETGHPDSSSNHEATPPQTLPISEDELSAVLVRFRQAYDTGNMNELIQLFASDARSDDDDNREAIARSYQKLFNVTDERRLALNDLRWRNIGDAVQGVGHFGVTVKEKGRYWESSYSGNISVRIQKRDGQVLITELDHSYDR